MNAETDPGRIPSADRRSVRIAKPARFRYTVLMPSRRSKAPNTHFRPLSAAAAALAIVCIVAGSSSGAEFLASFSDLPPGAPYYDAVAYLENRKVLSGYPDGTIGVEKSINRAELAKMLVEYTRPEEAIAGIRTSFPDVEVDAWYEKYIAAAERLGIMSGYPDGTVKPGDAVNVAEALKMIVKATNTPEATERVQDPQYQKPELWYMVYVFTLAREQALDPNLQKPENDMPRGSVAYALYRLALNNGMIAHAAAPDSGPTPADIYAAQGWQQQNAQNAQAYAAWLMAVQIANMQGLPPPPRPTAGLGSASSFPPLGSPQQGESASSQGGNQNGGQSSGGGGGSQGGGASQGGGNSQGGGGSQGSAGSQGGGGSQGGQSSSALGQCIRTGCAGEICSDAPVTPGLCFPRPEYACYSQYGICERHAVTGDCGWRQTAELNACLDSYQNPGGGGSSSAVSSAKSSSVASSSKSSAAQSSAGEDWGIGGDPVPPRPFQRVISTAIPGIPGGATWLEDGVNTLSHDGRLGGVAGSNDLINLPGGLPIPLDGDGITAQLSADGEDALLLRRTFAHPGGQGAAVHRRSMPATEAIAHMSYGAEAKFSANGRVIAYQSGDFRSVYIVDRNVCSNIKMPNQEADAYYKPVGVSDDGRYVAYSKRAYDPETGFWPANLYVYDRNTGVQTLAGLFEDGTPVGGIISRNLRYVASHRYVTQFRRVAFVHDRATGTTEYFLNGTPYEQYNSAVDGISANGRYVFVMISFHRIFPRPGGGEEYRNFDWSMRYDRLTRTFVDLDNDNTGNLTIYSGDGNTYVFQNHIGVFPGSSEPDTGLVSTMPPMNCHPLGQPI